MKEYGYKQFHKMQAYYKVSKIDDSGHKCLYGGTDRFRVIDFVSYETHIFECIYDSKYDKYVIKFHSSNPYSYSPTTSRQLNSFLNEFMIPICRDDIENAYLHCVGRTPDVADYHVSDRVCIEIWSY